MPCITGCPSVATTDDDDDDDDDYHDCDSHDDGRLARALSAHTRSQLREPAELTAAGP